MTPKQQLIKELEPLLWIAEGAIRSNDIEAARDVSRGMLVLIAKYTRVLDDEEIRDALNNPVANEIAKRLGVGPDLRP